MIVAFRGRRDEDGELHVWTQDSAGREERLEHYVHHSPAGFECGYAGSGPADLALAMCVAILGRGEDVKLHRGQRVSQSAWDAHQVVKACFITRLPRTEEWTLSAHEVRDVAQAEARKRQFPYYRP